MHRSDSQKWFYVGLFLAWLGAAGAVWTYLISTLPGKSNYLGFSLIWVLVTLLSVALSLGRLHRVDRLKHALEVIVSTPIIALVTLVLVSPAISQIAPRKTQCLSNIKRLSTAILLYRQDNDGAFPAGNVWRSSSARYLERQGDLRCPWADTDYSYGMNSQVAGRSDAMLAEPETLVMLFEGSSDIPNFIGGPRDFVVRHMEMGSVGFADAHAKYLKPADPRMRWKP